MSISSLTANPPNPRANYFMNSLQVESDLVANPITQSAVNILPLENGTFVYNSTTNQFEGVVSGAFVPFAMGTSATGPTGPTGPVNQSGMQLVATGTVNATNVTISSIPQTYNNLNLIITFQTHTSSSTTTLNINLGSGGLYDWSLFSSSNLFDQGASNGVIGLLTDTNEDVASCSYNVTIPAYCINPGTTPRTAISTFAASTGGGTASSIWSATDPITSINFYTSDNTTMSNGIYYLYGY